MKKNYKGPQLLMCDEGAGEDNTTFHGPYFVWMLDFGQYFWSNASVNFFRNGRIARFTVSDVALSKHGMLDDTPIGQLKLQRENKF